MLINPFIYVLLCVDYLALPRLVADAAHRVLLEPALGLGVRWAPGAVEEVVSTAAGNPFMLQKLGHEAWLARSPSSAGDVIALEDVRAAQEVTASSMAGGMFRGRWAKATPVEQALLTGMAMVAAAEGAVATGDLVAATGRTTPQWSLARRSLIDKGLIEAAGHGVLRFTMPTFAEFVRDVTGVEYLGPGLGTAARLNPSGAPELPRRPPPGDPGASSAPPPTAPTN